MVQEGLMWNDTFPKIIFGLEQICEAVADSAGRKVGDMHSNSLFPESLPLSIYNKF